MAKFKANAVKFLIGDRSYRLCQVLVDDVKELAKVTPLPELFKFLNGLFGKFYTSDIGTVEDLIRHFGRYIAENCNQIPLAYRMAMSRTGGLPLELSEKIFSYSGFPDLYREFKHLVEEFHPKYVALNEAVEKANANLKAFQRDLPVHFEPVEDRLVPAIKKAFKKYNVHGRESWYRSLGMIANFENVVDKLGITDFLDRVILFNAKITAETEPARLALFKELQPYQTLVDKYIRLLVTVLRLTKMGLGTAFVDLLSSCVTTINKNAPILRDTVPTNILQAIEKAPRILENSYAILYLVLGALFSEIKANRPDAPLETAFAALVGFEGSLDSWRLFLDAYALLHYPKFVEFAKVQTAEDLKLYDEYNDLELLDK